MRHAKRRPLSERHLEALTEISALKAQRDELLKALEAAVEWVPLIPVDYADPHGRNIAERMRHFVSQWQAAIRKTKQEA